MRFLQRKSLLQQEQELTLEMQRFLQRKSLPQQELEMRRFLQRKSRLQQELAHCQRKSLPEPVAW
jgi:hypothetical protein